MKTSNPICSVVLAIAVTLLGAGCTEDVPVMPLGINHDGTVVSEAWNMLEQLGRDSPDVPANAALALSSKANTAKFLDQVCESPGVEIVAVAASAPKAIDGIFLIGAPHSNKCSDTLVLTMKERLGVYGPATMSGTLIAVSTVEVLGIYVKAKPPYLSTLWKSNPDIRLVKVYDNAMPDLPSADHPLSNLVTK